MGGGGGASNRTGGKGKSGGGRGSTSRKAAKARAITQTTSRSIRTGAGRAVDVRKSNLIGVSSVYRGRAFLGSIVHTDKGFRAFPGMRLNSRAKMYDAIERSKTSTSGAASVGRRLDTLVKAARYLDRS